MKLLFYGLLALPLALVGLPLTIYVPTLYVQHTALDVGTVGMVILLARFFDMLMDPWIGHLSDRVASRHLLIVAGAMLLLAGFYGLTHPHPDHGAGYLGSVSLSVYAGWSLMTIPYFAMSADLGSHSDENTLYASYREFFSMIGVLMALVVPYLFDVAHDARQSLHLLWNLSLILVPLCTLLFVVTVRPLRWPRASVSFGVALRRFYAQLRQSPHIYGAFFMNHLANAVPATLFLFFITHVMHQSEDAGMLLLIYFISGVAALPIWIKLSLVTSKITAWAASILLAMGAFLVVPFLGAGDGTHFMIVTLVSGVSLGADMALPASIQTDYAQKAQAQGSELSGMIFGVWAMLTKLALALAVGMGFGILAWVDFDPAMPDAVSLSLLSWSYGGVPVLLKLCALFLILRIPHQSTRNAYEKTHTLRKMV